MLAVSMCDVFRVEAVGPINAIKILTLWQN